MEETTNLHLKKPEGDDPADIGDINDNMDTLDEAVAGKKDLQTAVTDPSAAGTAVNFIATISQNTNGVITPTKSTVRTVSKGNTGLCPALPNESTTTKYLRQDGTWVAPPNTTYSAGTGLTLSGTTFSLSTSYLPLSGGTVTGVTTFSNNTASSSTSTGAVKITGGLGVGGNIYGSKVYNAVWNDMAECRNAETMEAGCCVREDADGIMKKTSERLMAGCRLTSDTFGFCMGETDEARTPIAIAGRVLAYPTGDVARYHLGDAVCSAPDGRIDVMTREEIKEYPERIIGTVSEIPTYDVWYGGTKENPQPVPVNGRIWIYVR